MNIEIIFRKFYSLFQVKTVTLIDDLTSLFLYIMKYYVNINPFIFFWQLLLLFYGSTVISVS
mgnify:CR=1 FL=1